jgi:hypothetical protein
VGTYFAARDRLLKDHRLKPGPFGLEVARLVHEAAVYTHGHGGLSTEVVGFRDSVLQTMSEPLMETGRDMEEAAQLLQATTAEVTESQAVLTQTMAELRTLTQTLGPMLLEQVRELRAARMAVLTETREMLAALRDVRKFFLEADYDKETTRLREFVTLCHELQALKTAGVLDAVCESAIRLAVREPAP